MRTLLLAMVACGGLVGCAGEACPEGVALTEADMGCACGDEVVDGLPGCGELQCNDGALEVVGVDEGDDTAGDTGEEGCG